MFSEDIDSLATELSAKYDADLVRTQVEALRKHGSAVDEPKLWLQTAVERGFQFTPIERIRRCACGSHRSRFLSRFVFWNLLGMRQCEDCGLVFVSPRLSQDAMDWLFNEQYFSRTEPSYWGERRVPIFKDIIRLLRRFAVETVLDVGAAYGHCVKWARDRGFDATGCDISEAAVTWGREHLGVPLTVGRIQELDYPAGSLDCVLSLDSLYYVADPASDLAAVRRLLKPGGILILRLRNNWRIEERARAAGQRTIGEQVVPPPHLWGFTPDTVSRVLRKCGFLTKLLEPAAYSRTALVPIYGVGLHANRVLARSPLRLPIMTRSFNVVSVRTDD